MTLFLLRTFGEIARADRKQSSIRVTLSNFIELFFIDYDFEIDRFFCMLSEAEGRSEAYESSLGPSSNFGQFQSQDLAKIWF